MPGWKKPSRTADNIRLIVCLLVMPVTASGESLDAPAELTPAFLEFLARCEAAPGQWRDPMSLEGEHWQVLDTQHVEQQDEEKRRNDD